MSYSDKIDSLKYTLAESGELDYEDTEVLLEYISELETMLRQAWHGDEWRVILNEEH